jgi:hypothetical protein
MDIITSFCELIAKSPDLQVHAVARLAESLVNFSENQALVQVSAFVIGEFATNEAGLIETFLRVLTLPQTSAETKVYIITALAKLAARFGNRETVQARLAELTRSNELEVQQRAGEMVKLLMHSEVCEEVLAPIAASSVEIEQNPIQIVDAGQPKQEGRPTDQDLLLMVLDDGPAPPPPKPRSGVGDLLDILGDISTPVRPQPAPVGPPELLRTSDIIVFGQSKANPANPKSFALKLDFFALGQSVYTDFAVDYNATVGWQTQIAPLSGNRVGPVGGPSVSQVVYVNNLNNSPFQLQVQMRYRFGAQPLSANGVIGTLPV